MRYGLKSGLIAAGIAATPALAIFFAPAMVLSFPAVFLTTFLLVLLSFIFTTWSSLMLVAGILFVAITTPFLFFVYRRHLVQSERTKTRLLLLFFFVLQYPILNLLTFGLLFLIHYPHQELTFQGGQAIMGMMLSVPAVAPFYILLGGLYDWVAGRGRPSLRP